MKDSDRYLKIVEWSEEDQAYVGSAPGLIYGGCHGADEREVFGIVDGELDSVALGDRGEVDVARLRETARGKNSQNCHQSREHDYHSFLKVM